MTSPRRASAPAGAGTQRTPCEGGRHQGTNVGDDPSASPGTRRRRSSKVIRDAVYGAPIEELARLVTEWRPFAADDPFGRFQCPRCRYFDHNGGTAIIVNTWRWRCAWCGAVGTKMELEDLVLHDPSAVQSLIEAVR